MSFRDQANSQEAAVDTIQDGATVQAVTSLDHGYNTSSPLAPAMSPDPSNDYTIYAFNNDASQSHLVNTAAPSQSSNVHYLSAPVPTRKNGKATMASLEASMAAIRPTSTVTDMTTIKAAIVVLTLTLPAEEVSQLMEPIESTLTSEESRASESTTSRDGHASPSHATKTSATRTTSQPAFATPVAVFSSSHGDVRVAVNTVSLAPVTFDRDGASKSPFSVSSYSSWSHSPERASTTTTATTTATRTHTVTSTVRYPFSSSSSSSSPTYSPLSSSSRSSRTHTVTQVVRIAASSSRTSSPTSEKIANLPSIAVRPVVPSSSVALGGMYTYTYSYTSTHADGKVGTFTTTKTSSAGEVTMAKSSGSPVISSTVPAPSENGTSGSTSTGGRNDGNHQDGGFFKFLRSLGSSRASIGLTTLVCLCIAATVLGLVAWCVLRRRNRRRRRRGVFGITVDHQTGRYTDIDSNVYSDDAAPAMRQIGSSSSNGSVGGNRGPQTYPRPLILQGGSQQGYPYLGALSLSQQEQQQEYTDHQRQQHQVSLQSAPMQTGTARLIDYTVEETDGQYKGITDEDWMEALGTPGRRKSSLDMSLVHHLSSRQREASTIPSASQQRRVSSGSVTSEDGSGDHARAPGGSIVSSLYLEPARHDNRAPLRSTYLGSFSASALHPLTNLNPFADSNRVTENEGVTVRAGHPVPNNQQAFFAAPPLRPNRPPSLTSSFNHAVEQAYPAITPVPATGFPAIASSTTQAHPLTPRSGIAPSETGSPVLKSVHEGYREGNLRSYTTAASAASAGGSPRGIGAASHTVAAAAPDGVPVQSAWGIKTISSVLNASSGAVLAAAHSLHRINNNNGSRIGGKRLRGTQSMSTSARGVYDEEKADRFTALPIVPTTSGSRRPSSRWSSFASSSGEGSILPGPMDRRMAQQLPSRFSVTISGTPPLRGGHGIDSPLRTAETSPNPTTTRSSTGSPLHSGWQLSHAQRQNFTIARRPPQLIASSGTLDSPVKEEVAMNLAAAASSPQFRADAGSPTRLTPPSPSSTAFMSPLATVPMERGTTEDSIVSTDYASTRPLSIAPSKAGSLSRYASLRSQMSVETAGQASVRDDEDDGETVIVGEARDGRRRSSTSNESRATARGGILGDSRAAQVQGASEAGERQESQEHRVAHRTNSAAEKGNATTADTTTMPGSLISDEEDGQTRIAAQLLKKRSLASMTGLAY